MAEVMAGLLFRPNFHRPCVGVGVGVGVGVLRDEASFVLRYIFATQLKDGVPTGLTQNDAVGLSTGLLLFY